MIDRQSEHTELSQAKTVLQNINKQTPSSTHFPLFHFYYSLFHLPSPYGHTTSITMSVPEQNAEIKNSQSGITYTHVYLKSWIMY